MSRLLEEQRYDIEGDLFAARVCGSRPELAVNYGYEGILTVDLAGRRVLPMIPFLGGDFSIYSWGMSPRGDVSIAFSVEPGEGVLFVDHDSGQAHRLAAPDDLPVLSDLMWFSPAIALLDYEGGSWMVDGSALRRAGPEETSIYLGHFPRRVLASYVVIKTDPYQRGLYVRSKEYARKTIGFMPQDASLDPLLLERDGTAIDVAVWGRELFTSFEKEILSTTANGTETLLTAREGELFVRINVIEHDTCAYLALVSSDQDHVRAAKGRVTFYEIISD